MTDYRIERIARVLFPLALFATGCSDGDPSGSGGEGSLTFTTWGEEYIEDEIPEDPGDGSGFSDGWRVSFDKFLVSFRNIVVADATGEVGARFEGALLFDNKLPGPKIIVEFDAVKAQAWQSVGYEIAPVATTTELAPGVPEDDKALMLEAGFSLYVAGTARKAEVAKRFAWGFAIATAHEECHSVQDGRKELGLIVRNNAGVEVELTTHGDHFFYDRLQHSDDPAVVTSLRFDALADADADDDGEVTLAELDAVLIDVRRYDPAGLGATTYGEFVSALARTVGHFRGEGECTVRAF
jgi:hypothetical protein